MLSYDDHESCVVIVVFAVAASPRLALLRLAATELLDTLRRGQSAALLLRVGVEG